MPPETWYYSGKGIAADAGFLIGDGAMKHELLGGRPPGVLHTGFAALTAR